MSASAEFQANKVLTGKKRWAALAFLALGVSMIILDATVVNDTVPNAVDQLLRIIDTEFTQRGITPCSTN